MALIKGSAARWSGQIVALIPAHNEEDSIQHTISALQAQTVPADRIIVIADNCSDETPALARAAGAEVMVTRGNTHKKAGALNYALEHVLPGLSDRPDRIEAVVKAARAAGATGLWAGMLHLKDGTREHFMSVLGKHWPELVPRYEQAYRERAYLPAAYGESTMKAVARFRTVHGVSDRRRVILKPPPEPEQLSLLN